MRQVAQVQRSGVLSVKEVPAPLLQSNGVVVQTAFSLISAGTERSKIEVARKSLLGKALAKPEQVRQAIDMLRQAGVAATYRKVSSRLDALSPLGYSLAGIVVAAGRNAGDFVPGDRVACAGAGLANHADFVSVPKSLCTRVPDSVGLDEAAYATVGAIALQGVRQAQPTLGETVGVIGLGLLGLLTVQLLRSNGCRVVGIDIDAERCRLAEDLGADLATTPTDPAIEAIARRFSPAGLDAVILCASTDSSEPVKLAGRLSREKGRVVVVGAIGLDIPRSPFYEKEIDVRLSRSYGPGRYDPQYEESGHDYPIGYVRWSEGRNLEAFVDQIAQRRIDVKRLTTHRFAIDEAERAYELLDGHGDQPYLGILLDYGLDANKASGPKPTSIAVNAHKRSTTDGTCIGLIGAGSFAQSMLLPHLVNSKLARLKTVVSITGLTARSVAERCGFEQCGQDAESVFSDPEIDLAIIATRHDSHSQLSAGAIAAAKAVFVEKPLAVTEEQLEELVLAWQAAPAPFVMVGFNRRFAPLVGPMKEFLAASREPAVMHYRINAGYVPREHWVQNPESGGGRIIGEVCHFVDLLGFLCGSLPVTVQAVAAPDGGRYSRDNVAVTLQFANGSIGTITYAANGDKGLSKERIEAFAGGRAVVLDDFRSLTLACGGRKQHKKSSPDKGHAAEMTALLTAVREGQESPVPFVEAVSATRATFAVLHSLATGLSVTIEGASR